VYVGLGALKLVRVVLKIVKFRIALFPFHVLVPLAPNLVVAPRISKCNCLRQVVGALPFTSGSSERPSQSAGAPAMSARLAKKCMLNARSETRVPGAMPRPRTSSGMRDASS
jgi:hypothetical protein